MNDLPLELYHELCEHVDISTLLALRLVSRHFVPSPHNRFWQRRIHRDYDIHVNDINTYNIQNKTHFTSWRHLWLFYSDINWWVHCGQENQPRQLRLMVYFHNCIADYIIPKLRKKRYSDITVSMREYFIQLSTQQRIQYGLSCFLMIGHLAATMIITGTSKLKDLVHLANCEQLLLYYADQEILTALRAYWS